MTTPLQDPVMEKTAPDTASTITLGAGCFWCVEPIYQQLEGVYSATSGYMGGHIVDPTYQEVCSKTSGHIEIVQVKYDRKALPLEELLKWFWKLHDPTQEDAQGNDVGPQYATAIFAENEADLAIAQTSLEDAQDEFTKPIATVIRPVETFYPAEDYHQNYYFLNKDSNSYCRFVITPKLDKLGLQK